MCGLQSVKMMWANSTHAQVHHLTNGQTFGSSMLFVVPNDAFTFATAFGNPNFALHLYRPVEFNIDYLKRVSFFMPVASTSGDKQCATIFFSTSSTADFSNIYLTNQDWDAGVQFDHPGMLTTQMEGASAEGWRLWCDNDSSSVYFPGDFVSS